MPLTDATVKKNLIVALNSITLTQWFCKPSSDMLRAKRLESFGEQIQQRS